MNFKYEPRIDFDPKPFLDAALQLVRSEDTNLAIKLLTDMLPGFYRDYPPPEISALKREISKSKCIVSDYANNNGDDLKSMEFCVASCQGLVRFSLLKQIIEEDNKNGITPHLIDLGPGDFTMPIGFNSLGLKFTYAPLGLYEKAKVDAKNLLEHCWMEREVKDRPVYFIAYEIIEHLENEFEIRQQLDRLSQLPSKVFLSTPLYTYADGNKNWARDKIAPHLRTYTPTEFFSVCHKMFPEYNFQYITVEVQTMVGELKHVT